jgi:hypothetical protein
LDFAQTFFCLSYLSLDPPSFPPSRATDATGQSQQWEVSKIFFVFYFVNANGLRIFLIFFSFLPDFLDIFSFYFMYLPYVPFCQFIYLSVYFVSFHCLSSGIAEKFLPFFWKWVDKVKIVAGKGRDEMTAR